MGARVDSARFFSGASKASICLALMFPALAHAQESSDAEEVIDLAAPETPSDEDASIIVTGSRLSTGFAAPSPVSVVSAARLQERGSTNIGDALNEIPAFRATNTPATGELTPAAGYIGGRILDLRGLGSVRTLTLVDGKRFVPSTTQATVDTNMIPGILLSRAEVVTGGASAQYGSDAVAGVANLILDHNLTGLRANAQFGIAQEGDNETYLLGAAYGVAVGDRGHLVLGGEWERLDGVGDCRAREFCLTETLNFGRNPGVTDIPANQIIPNVRPSSAPFNGVTTPTGYIGMQPILGPVGGITFEDDGTPRRFDYGSSVSGFFMVGGEGRGEAIFFKDLFLIAPTERVAVTGMFDYELTDSIKASVMVNYGHVTGEYSVGQYWNTGVTIQADNPFIPRSTDPTLDIPTILAANNLTSFKFGKGFDELGRIPIVMKNEVFRGVFALEGELSSSWSWDAYYQYGRNSYRADTTGSTVTSRMVAALDVTTDVGGQPICRINADSVTTNDDPTCVPFNPFGNQASAAAIASVKADAFQTNVTTQNTLAANLRGSLFELPAGPVGIAIGGEYRSDKVTGEADQLSKDLAFFRGNGSDIAGQISVLEGYVETEIPILADVPFFNELSVNGAARRTHYSREAAGSPSTTVDVTTWKVGGIWEPTDGLRFRATRSRDIRAPNVTELFGPLTQGSGILTDPANGGLQTVAMVISGSNAALEPEKADTLTLGIVVDPAGGALDRFRASVDYYDIAISGAIATLGQQTIVTNCYQGDAKACALVDRSGGTPNLVTVVRDVPQNVAELTNRGLDVELAYTQPLGGMGDLDLRLLGNFVFEYKSSGLERAGQTGLRGGTPAGVPDFTADAMIGWSQGPFRLNTHVRYINKGFYNAAFIGPDDPAYDVALPNSTNDNTVPSRTYVDLLAQYTMDLGVEQSAQIYVGVDNLFNTYPPLSPGSHGTGNGLLFSPVGRSFKAGVRLSY